MSFAKAKLPGSKVTTLSEQSPSSEDASERSGPAHVAPRLAIHPFHEKIP